jgi:outer membrane autotransporter protein
MIKSLPYTLASLAVLAWASSATAHDIVVLPGVVGPVGVVSGVTTQGPGTLTVGAQDINTSNEPGGGVTTDAADTANIVFNGTSTVTGYTGTTGSTFLNIRAGANATTVTFKGQVFSTTFTVAGSGVVNFNGGYVSNTGSTMDFAGDGFINVAAGQTVKAALTNSAGANTGTLTLNGGSIFDGAVGAASGLKRINVVGGNALITGQAKAGSFSLGTNTLNVAGALSIPVAGTINTTIFSPTLYGKIVPVGAATIGNGLNVIVTVTGPIANGTSFNIVDASSGTTGSTVLVTTNTTRYAFTAAPTVAGQVKITTTQIPLAVVVAPIVAAPGAPPVVNPVAPVLVAPVIDALPVTPVTAPLLTAITLLPDAPAVTAALAQLPPGSAGLAAPGVSYRATDRFSDLLASHMEAEAACSFDGQPNDQRRSRLDDSANCQAGDRRGHWWAAGFTQSAKQGDVSGFEGNDSRINGVMLAYDQPMGAAGRAGLGVRYAKATVDGNGQTSTASVTSYQVVAYASYAPGPAFINGAVAYGTDSYRGTRTVVFPGVSSNETAKYGGKQLSAFVMAGRHIYLGDGATVLTPYAGVQYTRLDADRYAEAGDAALNLNVDAQRYNFGQATLGVKLARETVLEGGQVLRPEVHANLLHSIGPETMSNTAAFSSGGPKFTTNGLKPERNTFDVGAGVVLAAGGRWSLEGAYDYLWRDQSYSAQRVRLSFVMRM